MMKRVWSCILVLMLLLAVSFEALADNAVVRLPDLMTFSGGQLRLTQSDTSRDFMAKYTLEGDADAVTSVVDEYVALLDNCGDVTPDSRFPLGTGRRIVTYECEAAGVKRFTVSNSDEGWSVKGISLCIEQISPTSLVFRVAAGLGFQDNGSRPQAGAGATGTVAAGTATSVPLLPDPYYFFQSQFRHREDAGGISMSFDAAGLDAVNEYVDLLQSDKFPLLLRDIQFTPTAYGSNKYYIFDYTGGQTLTGGQMQINGQMANAAVILWVDDQTGMANGSVSFTIVADKIFTYVDDGSRVSYTTYADLTDASQPCAPYGQGKAASVVSFPTNDDDDDDDDDDFFSLGTEDEICHYCGGDGIDRMCFQCGGDGVMDGSHERCSACHGTGEHECSFCGGTGRR